ncbi:DUF1573 domain-containing protein [Chitinophaga varians]|uniref:DUF1573 domain-containing protein n=1 Tax=Chitinophaga varians TaxID=2202339 RepID=UPI00165EDDD4|nr:DUF1573 domain-containing protein [Chitinophaga varians]MBC9911131.1 DUF1573 domain-containing protein [Chitinophaga varians]
MRTRWWIILLILLQMSCAPDKPEFLNGTLKQAFATASGEHKLLFVIYAGEGCPPCDDFIRKIKTDKLIAKELSGKVLFTIAYKNKPDDQAFFYPFFTMATPGSYLFSPDGRLLTIIDGDAPSKYVVSCTENCLSGKTIQHEFKTRLQTKHGQAIWLFNQLLTAQQILSQSGTDKAAAQSARTILDSTLRQETYFYNTYLSAKASSILGDTARARALALKSLEFNSSLDLALYASLRNEMKFAADKSYTPAEDAFITLSETTHQYGTVATGSYTKTSVRFRNSGKKPLLIQQMLGSCDCMTFNWPKNPVLPGREDSMQITYHARSEGEFSKIVFVSSNASNAQVQINVKGLAE